VADQVRHFGDLLGPSDGSLVLDIGGDCGFFAKGLSDILGYAVRVLEMDPSSVETCLQQGIDARLGDALKPDVRGDEKIVCFNLILHHLVGRNEQETCSLQLRALRAWQGADVKVFVNEYIYQSYIGYMSARLIYQITSSKLLSAFGRIVGRVIPAFRANTFGVGVRFRSHEEWLTMFAKAGFRVIGKRIGDREHISPPLRLLAIKAIRRDSFLLESA
jgi:hypothetical protein